ncbi:MAG: AAA family ATPase [Mycobacteriales bacterium]
MAYSGAGRLLIITGASAAGKTTVGYAVAAQLPRAVHVDGDTVHQFVVSGAVPMDLPPPPGGEEQLRLRYSGALAVAQVYLRAGFDAVITDNIFEADLIDILSLALADVATETAYLVMLNPSVGVIRERYAARPGGGYTDSITPEGMADAVARTPRLGLWLNNGSQTPTESAAEIIGRLGQAAVSKHDLIAAAGPG